MATRMQLRRGTAAQWSAVNPVLAGGEPGVELAPGVEKLKIGDGSSTWSALPYASGGGGSGTAGLSAYQVAVANGFVGDQATWLASLQGQPGQDGLPGTAGVDGVDGADGSDNKITQNANGTWNLRISKVTDPSKVCLWRWVVAGSNPPPLNADYMSDTYPYDELDDCRGA